MLQAKVSFLQGCFHVLTLLTGKGCVLLNSFSTRNSWLAACDVFRMFTQSIKFYIFYYHVLRVQVLEKCDSSSRQ